MESPTSIPKPNSTSNEEEEEEDSFLDAFDELPSPDCFVCDPQSDPEPFAGEPIDPPEPDPPSTTLRRRRSHGLKPKGSDPESSALSRARKYRLQRQLNERERDKEKEKGNEELGSIRGHESSVEAPEKEESTVTTARDDELIQIQIQSSAESPELGDSSSNLLELLAGFVIKAIGFQIRLMLTFITFPFSLLYKVYAFAVDPFGTMLLYRNNVIEKSTEVWDMICGSIGSLLSDWFGDHKSIWDVLVRYGLGLLWSAYVWFLLCGFLVSSFLVSGILMRYLVEEPLHMKEALNFDYTRNSPEAFVAVTSCAGAGCGVKCKELTEAQKSGGVHSLRQRLQASVKLALPESDYNRKLGMFQVRVDFLSADGTILSSSSQPCILHFKSDPIRLVLTFFKAAPLLTGYSSESQILNLKFKGFAEESVPTACLKVLIEPRAEYRRGAGVPELYDASMILESELPLFRRIIWYWKKTVFIWLSIMSFSMELLLAIICCRPLIIPRSRTRGA